MSKLDSKPKHVANIPLTSHDLSHTLDYTSTTGMILPVCHDILNPGEKIRCKVDVSQTRTMPVASAAFADIDIHVDYYFVPLSLLYTPFTSFIYQINDTFTSALGNDGTLPLLNLRQESVNISSNRANTPDSDSNFDCLGKGYFRLLDMFGMNPFHADMVDSHSNDVDFNPTVFPWQLLAYQAIYQYFYRLDDYEQFDPAAFNVDAYNGNSLPNNTYCNLQYRPNYMDYFNSVKNSPIVTKTNLTNQPDALPLAKSWLSRENSRPSSSVLRNGGTGSESIYITSTPSYVDGLVNTEFGFRAVSSAESDGLPNLLGSPNGSDINTANLRAMFANEKLWSITGAAKKTYDAQTLAHFGFNVPTDVLHQVSHLGHDVTPIRIGEVISTAGTDSQPLGTVAGKGYAVGGAGKGCQFTAPCHGVFMAVTSAMVRQSYYNGFDKINAVAEWQDFYQPEFDHLGMQPVFGYERSFDADNSADMLGWQYRYEQWKRKYNRVTQAFSDGYFATWTVARRPFGGTAPQSVALPTSYKWSFYQRPTALNDIMVAQYTTAWTADYVSAPETIYENDPLVTHAYIDYKKLSTMSAFSMPRLDA